MLEIVDSSAGEKPVLFTSTMDLLATTPPFKAFGLERMVRSVQHQIDSNTCLFGIENGRLCAYLGWIVTSRGVVEDWRDNDGPLHPAPEAEAIVVTILAVNSPRAILPMIKKAKTVSHGLPVYWKRIGEDGISEDIRSVP